MADIRDLIPDAQRYHETSPGSWFAYFASAPITVNDFAYVIIPDVDRSVKFGPCTWEPVRWRLVPGRPPSLNVGPPLSFDPGTPPTLQPVLPIVGDPCLVMPDNRSTWWVLTWKPISGEV